MPAPHYHRGSIYGDGPRRALDRDQRARFRFLLNAHRRANRLTPMTEIVGNALLKRLGVDGRCDPSHQTLADDAGCDERTVRRALDGLQGLGLVLWVNRLVRDGWRAVQGSNAYLLAPSDVANPPAIRPRSSDGHSARQTLQSDISTVPQSVLEVSDRERMGAREALARVAARRQVAIQASLLNRGSGSTGRAF
jgi:hypothetical protein